MNIQKPFDEGAMEVTQIIKWYNCFKNGCLSVESGTRSSRPSTSRNDEIIDTVCTLVMTKVCDNPRTCRSGGNRCWFSKSHYEREFLPVECQWNLCQGCWQQRKLFFSDSIQLNFVTAPVVSQKNVCKSCNSERMSLYVNNSIVIVLIHL